jgi:hypothetical protein
MHMTCFSQRDPRWAEEKLGTGVFTIGASGCLITAMASICVDFGVPTDPHRLNQWLIGAHGYRSDNLFVFSSVGGLGVDLVDHVNCEYTPAPAELLSDALDGGCGVVIMVDHHPGGHVNQHWVRLISLQERGGWIMDPWRKPGSEMTALNDYLMDDWNAARGIFAAATYTRADGAMFETLSRGGAVQETVAVRKT